MCGEKGCACECLCVCVSRGDVFVWGGGVERCVEEDRVCVHVHKRLCVRGCKAVFLFV